MGVVHIPRSHLPVDYSGADYEAANRAYYASPERQAVDPEPTRHLTNTEH
jgi:hypothetical protein